MMTPADQGGPDELLARLTLQAREWERRTFSNVTVATSGGVNILEVTPIPPTKARSKVVIRDDSGDAILQNDTVAGWGLTAPVSGMSAYPAFPMMHGTETVFTSRWEFYGFMYGLQLEGSYQHGTEFTGTFSECQMEYQWDGGSATTIPNTFSSSDADVTSNAVAIVAWTYTIPPPPTAARGLTVRLMQRKASGTGAQTFSGPLYLNMF